MTAKDLLRKLMAMVENTDFNRCSDSRALKGRYDVWKNNHLSDLMKIEAEAVTEAEEFRELAEQLEEEIDYPGE